jgi:hypothetical protein
MVREQEYPGVSACPFASNRTLIVPDDPHEKWVSAEGSEHDESHLPCVSSPELATIRIQPMRMMGRSNKAGPRWNAEAFHETLRSPTPDNALVLFQGMARESLAVVLSPKPSFVMKHSYEVFFGHQGNTVTTVQRKSSRDESLSVTLPGRVCQEKAWTSYWICLSEEKLYVGVGSVPGQQLVAILDDLARQDAPSSEEHAVHYVGFGNASTGDRQAPSPLKLRGLCVTTIPDSLRTRLASLITAKDVSMIQLGRDEMDVETKALMDEYQQECSKARARASKFGIPYQEPAPDAFVPWSQARRLRANPKQGFITGMDLSDPVEKAKQEARQKRFGTVAGEVSTGSATGEGEISSIIETQVLPIIQAWDNEGFVRSQRTDPPTLFWKNPPPDSSFDEPKNEFSMDEDPVTLISAKIHIFSIDWAAFKQIRTNDIMAHFSIYGPSYIEWLGDLSCNVCFEDAYSATRALENMSQELPTPAPETIQSGGTPPDLGNMNWRFGKSLLRKVSNDRFGRKGTTARLLMRTATSMDILLERPQSWPKPPPGFTTKRVLGPGSNVRPKKGKRERLSLRNDCFLPENDEPNPLGLLSGGLKAGRSGFSVEELEVERRQKRARLTPDKEFMTQE